MYEPRFVFALIYIARYTISDFSGSMSYWEANPLWLFEIPCSPTA